MFRYFIVGLLGTFILAGCSSPKVVRVPSPLVEMSSPYSLHRDWVLRQDAFKYSDSEGLYFLDEGKFLYFGVPSGVLTKALKAPTSRWTDQVIWQQKYNEPIMSGLTSYKNQLIFGTAKGSLMSVSKDNGELSWKTQLSSEVLSRATIGGSVVFVRTVDGKLYAINAETGEVNWATEHPMPNLSLRGIAPVTYRDGIVFVGWESGKVEALDAVTGERKWQTQVLIPKGRTDLERMVDIQAELVLQGGRLFVLGYHGKLVALNPENGNLYWNRDISGFRDFVMDDKALYLVDDDDIVFAINYVNGTTLWKQTHFKYRQLIDLAFYDNSQLILADGEGYIHWIDMLDGTQVARAKHSNEYGDGNRIVRIWVSGTKLYVQDATGDQTAYTVKVADWYQFHHPKQAQRLIKEKHASE